MDRSVRWEGRLFCGLGRICVMVSPSPLFVLLLNHFSEKFCEEIPQLIPVIYQGRRGPGAHSSTAACPSRCGLGARIALHSKIATASKSVESYYFNSCVLVLTITIPANARYYIHVSVPANIVSSGLHAPLSHQVCAHVSLSNLRYRQLSSCS